MKLLCDNFEFSKNFLLCQLGEYNNADVYNIFFINFYNFFFFFFFL